MRTHIDRYDDGQARHTDGQTDIQIDRQINGLTVRDRERGRGREIKREGETPRERQRDRYRETERDR